MNRPSAFSAMPSSASCIVRRNPPPRRRLTRILRGLPTVAIASCLLTNCSLILGDSFGGLSSIDNGSISASEADAATSGASVTSTVVSSSGDGGQSSYVSPHVSSTQVSESSERGHSSERVETQATTHPGQDSQPVDGGHVTEVVPETTDEHQTTADNRTTESATTEHAPTNDSATSESNASNDTKTESTSEPEACVESPLLISDMEFAGPVDGPWANDDAPALPTGILVQGYYCSRYDEETQTSVGCDAPDGSGGSVEGSLAVVDDAAEARCGARALKGVVKNIEQLMISVDLDAQFEATAYAGIRVWAKGSGKFIAGLTEGGDWWPNTPANGRSVLPPLRADAWQRYDLYWHELAASPGATPVGFPILSGKPAGHLDASAASGKKRKLSFRVESSSGSDAEELVLFLDDLSFISMD